MGHGANFSELVLILGGFTRILGVLAKFMVFLVMQGAFFSVKFLRQKVANAYVYAFRRLHQTRPEGVHFTK